MFEWLQLSRRKCINEDEGCPAGSDPITGFLDLSAMPELTGQSAFKATLTDRAARQDKTTSEAVAARKKQEEEKIRL